MIKYAILAEHARVDGDAAHLLGASPYVYVPGLPVVRSFALLVESLFTEEECAREHGLTAAVVTPSGQEVLSIAFSTTPEWPQVRPPAGLVRTAVAVNALMPLTEAGDHKVLLSQDGGDRQRLRGVTRTQIEEALNHELRRTPGQPGSVWIWGMTGGRVLKVCVSTPVRGADRFVITVAWPDRALP